MCVVARTKSYFTSTVINDLIFDGWGAADQCSEQLSLVFVKGLPDTRKRSTISNDV